MARHALLGVAALLLVACATYRLPEHPHSDGSFTNQVLYAYFALAYERYGTPAAFSQFFLDQDEEVVFVLRLNKPDRAFTVAAALLRPDGTTTRDFRENVAAPPFGASRMYFRTERYAMSELRAYPGAWTLRLLIDGELAGIYGFRLVDTASMSRPR